MRRRVRASSLARRPGKTSRSAQAQAWTFPHHKGHVRAVPVGSVSSTATLFSELASPVFDTATRIPPATASWTGTGCLRFSSSCRTVFTNLAGGARPPRVMIEDGNKTAIGALVGLTVAAARDEALQRVVGLSTAGTSAPVLGGVDRSSIAVIEASPLASGNRPVMAYVGGLDGMLHAICASVQGACTELGMELWAFVPRTQLAYLETNNAMVNGTPRVADVYGDFGNLFQLDAATGRSRHGSDPAASPCVSPACAALYQFATDYHPIGAAPTIYSIGGVTYVPALPSRSPRLQRRPRPLDRQPVLAGGAITG